MRRLRLLTFMAPLLAALACTDATAPPSPAGLEVRTPQSALVILATTPQVSAGWLHTCALKADGRVVCWGYNGQGQAAVPGGLESIAEVSAGGNHTCALETDGTVVCWGYNFYGESLVPIGLGSVAQVSAGANHTCALKPDQTVVCWGRNDVGQATVPSGLVSVARVSAGGYHTCALKTDGTVICWGDNSQGQTNVLGGLTSVAQVSGGLYHTCALKTDGTVVCWGRNDVGQATVPSGLVSVAQVSAGIYHNCALRTDGTVSCWGRHAQFFVPGGQLFVPGGLASVAQVSASGYHACALKTDGTVVCWYYNWWSTYYGQAAVPAGLNLNSTLPPNAEAGPAFTQLEGTPISFNGSGSTDPQGSALTYSWSFGDGSALATGVSPSHTYVENGTYTVTLTVSNGSSTSTATTTATIINVAPFVGAITGPIAPVQVNTTITANATFTDPGTLDTHTAVFNWGDGTSSAAAVTQGGGSGSASGTHVYVAAGVYTITLTVTDNDGATAQSVFEFVVVFDPAAGFVSGSGWINSPAGAYVPDVSLSGRATFGFVSTYQKGATVPSGNTRFQFHAGDLRFMSTAYDWLVIAGPQAKFKGSGTINGAGDFGFLVSAVDGDLNGGGSTDKFRIKIWDKVTGSVIYDNQTGAADDAAATTVIEAGNIAIHK